MPDPRIEGAIRHLAAGHWESAHRLVQEIDGEDAAWIHAHLHRLEGDLANAAYWYRQAGKPVATGSLDEEREEITAALKNR